MSENATNSLFSGKVYCGLCNWKYRAKKERNKKVYICSKYSTGKDGGMRKVVAEIAKNRIPIRPDRKIERKLPRKKRFHMNKKDVL
jgi:hypothetical protein